MSSRITIAFIFACTFLGACSTASVQLGGGNQLQTPAPCGLPPPVPIAELWLSYPQPGATSVPLNIGEIVFAGADTGYFGSDTVSVSSSTQATVPVGAFTAAPSPMPTPFATPPNSSGNVPYEAVPIPTLSPSTTYNVSYTYRDWSSKPPSCTQKITEQLGAFTTQ